MSDFYYTRNDNRKNMLLVTNDIETDEFEQINSLNALSAVLQIIHSFLYSILFTLFYQ